MIKTVLKFFGILLFTGFTMILIASIFPSLQTSFFGFATYILPWVVAIISVKKKKAVENAATNSTHNRKSVSYNSAPKAKATPEKQVAVIQQPAINEHPVCTPNALDKKVPAAPVQSDTKTKTYKVAGVSHYVDNIMRLACENTDYEMSKRELIDDGFVEEKVWKYNFYPSNLELQPEPDNPHDPNAIKVIIDGEHVGYIKSGSCAHVRKIINEGSVVRADCIIGGGPYKYISEDYDYEKDKEVYALEKGTTNFFVHLELTESN